jgi:DNA-binding PadR family transcriptional regulator
MPPGAADPRSFLPLTPLASQVLLALAEGPRHGYGIILEVGERTAGLITLRTGTLYLLLQRLVSQGLIAESSNFALRQAQGVPSSSRDELRTSKFTEEKVDQRRRYYHLTPLGQRVLAAEARRLEGVVNEARRTRVIGRATR